MSIVLGRNKKSPPPTVTLETYLRLFAPYEAQMSEFTGRDGEYGGRFALLFRQITRLLVQPANINRRLPKLYLSLAERYLSNDHDTVRHFSYEDNRYFFLSELLEWLKVHERGDRMREMGK